MRPPTALVAQREFRQSHGDRIAAALDLNKIGIPVLNRRAEIFWILDGQHRIYALKKFFADGDQIMCEVYENLTDGQMADIFLGRDDRKAIQQFDKFCVSCTAGRKRENDVRRIVEANGMKVARDEQEHTIGAVTALLKVYDRSGDIVLGQSLRTLDKAWDGDRRAFRSELIEGIALVYNRFNGRTNEKRMVQQLSDLPRGPQAVQHRAEVQRQRTGSPKMQCIAAAIVEIYNKGLTAKKERLTDWWKGNGEVEQP